MSMALKYAEQGSEAPRTPKPGKLGLLLVAWSAAVFATVYGLISVLG